MSQQFLSWLSDESYLLENITFVIAILAFGLSLYNFVLEKIHSRRRLELTVIDVFLMGESEATGWIEAVYVQLINDSERSITVHSMDVFCGDNQDSFGTYRKYLFKEKVEFKGAEPRLNIWYSDNLPLYVKEKSSLSRLLTSNSEDKRTIVPGEDIKVRLSTSRGELEYTLTIDCFSSLGLLLQCRAPE